jgi:hypothetical protein
VEEGRGSRPKTTARRRRRPGISAGFSGSFFYRSLPSCANLDRSTLGSDDWKISAARVWEGSGRCRPANNRSEETKEFPLMNGPIYDDSQARAGVRSLTAKQCVHGVCDACQARDAQHSVLSSSPGWLATTRRDDVVRT